MTKNDIAKDINYIAKYVTRTIGRDNIDYEIGQILTTTRPESWAFEPDASFNIENTNYKYEVLFICRDLPCHKVDYENEEEVEILNAVEGEGEVLVPEETKFEIVGISTEDDYEEMGYYEIELAAI